MSAPLDVDPDRPSGAHWRFDGTCRRRLSHLVPARRCKALNCQPELLSSDNYY